MTPKIMKSCHKEEYCVGELKHSMSVDATLMGDLSEISGIVTESTHKF